jgi:cobyrinic acid a,c-diamide synthase
VIQINRQAHDKKRSLVLVSSDELEQLEKLATQLVEIQQHEQDAKDLKPIARHTHERLLDTIKSHKP